MELGQRKSKLSFFVKLKYRMMQMPDMLILVDENDRQIGTEEKMKAHEQGKLHRAFSIFIFNPKGEMLLQKRAKSKYHSGGLWTNACCSHPRVGEELEKAAHRRLREEMGFDCELENENHFIYKVKLDHGLTEHEFDYVFAGKYDGEVKPNTEEADVFKWIDMKTLGKDIEAHPENYTEWFKIAFRKFFKSFDMV